jgi:hypothetical protein
MPRGPKLNHYRIIWSQGCKHLAANDRDQNPAGYFLNIFARLPGTRTT